MVGSAQSGAQIAADLAESGRQVYLCTSKVARVVRRYRGRDIMEWMVELGMTHQTVDALPDPAMRYARQAVIAGGHTLSLQHLGRLGVTLLGRLGGVDGTLLEIGSELAEHVAFGRGFHRTTAGPLGR